MKIPTKLLLLVAMSLAASIGVRAADNASDAPPAAPAGDHPRMQEMRERRMKQLDEKLSLTADQKAQINAIWDKAEADARAAREDASATAKEDRRAKVRESMKAVRQQVRGVLTPEQQKIFDTMPQDRRGGGPGGPRPSGDQK
jgi:Spy/CpxP family protein refolding chaperone